MAVNFDYKGKQAALFQAKPDVQMNIQFEDGKHVWIFKNSASFLQSELTRFLLEIQSLASEASKVENIDEDPEAAKAFMEGMRSAVKRLQSAFNANVTSEDGSAEKWIDENINDFETIGTMLTEMIKSVKGQQ